MKRTIINPIFKDTITFLEMPAEVNGTCSDHLVTLMPGGGNPPHIHKAFEETFTAVKGILGIQLKRQRKLLLPGESYTVQKNEVHNFYNPTQEEISFKISFTPAHKGMEYALRIVYGLAADGLTNKKGIPKSLYTIALLSEMSGSAFTGFISVINPLVSVLARKARKKGIEKKLMQQYCS